MRWKTSIIAAAIVVFTLFSAAGCTAAGTIAATTTTAAVQSPVESGRHQPFSDNGTLPEFPSDNGTRPGGPGGQLTSRIDWAAAAENLGVTEDDLKAAFGENMQGMPDFAAVAKKLGVTEDALKSALNLPDNMTPPGDGRNQPPQGDPPQNSAQGKTDTGVK